MIPQRIQRKRTKGWKKPEGAAYVGRGTVWGNPYRVGDESAFMSTGAPVFGLEEPLTAEDVVQLYRLDLANSMLGPEVYDRIRTHLAGKDLMCWCPLTQPCHADVLLELANGDRLPVGTPVLFWPDATVGEGRPSVTRTPIWKMGSGTEVVSVEGYPGGIALTHIQTLPVGATTTGLDHTPSTTAEGVA